MKKTWKSTISWGLASAVALAFAIGGASPVYADAALYKKHCKKCHGTEGQGKKSKKDPSKFTYDPINQMTKEELVKSLQDYRDKFNSGEKLEKSVKKMAKPAAKLDDSQIESIAEFVASLKK